MPYCSQCGAQNPESSAFCRSCGTALNPQSQENVYTPPAYDQPVYPQPTYTYSSPRTLTQMPVVAKVLSIVSMACGITSCATLFMGFLFSIAALVTSGISRSKTPEGVSNTKARVGLITGIIGIVLSIIWIFIYAEIFSEIFEDIGRYDHYYGYDYYYDF